MNMGHKGHNFIRLVLGLRTISQLFTKILMRQTMSGCLSLTHRLIIFSPPFTFFPITIAAKKL